MKQISLRRLAAVFLFGLCLLVRAGEPVRLVVFVCEHGSVKSLMAASYFNRMAEEQKLDVRAIARGTAPEAAVPAGVVAKLKEDGFDVAGFKPQPLAKNEGDHAVAVVAFCEVSRDLAEPAKVVGWLDIPPASTDYAKAKAAMLPKITALVAELKSK